MSPEEIAVLVAVIETDGRYWWRDNDGNCYATHDYTDGSADTYLLYASPSWVAQWDEDWTAAAHALNNNMIAAQGGDNG
ncbi:hypothetical protein [Mycolicibacterium palauense]|uniref:hypothetical protein n=1 Tax=Mycolicibacterium palauense TaxID=2034511 RepID=UPI000BFEB70B|nr:hypothetical protein [Mycolicibacterium palauense]